MIEFALAFTMMSAIMTIIFAGYSASTRDIKGVIFQMSLATFNGWMFFINLSMYIENFKG